MVIDYLKWPSNNKFRPVIFVNRTVWHQTQQDGFSKGSAHRTQQSKIYWRGVEKLGNLSERIRPKRERKPQRKYPQKSGNVWKTTDKDRTQSSQALFVEILKKELSHCLNSNCSMSQVFMESILRVNLKNCKPRSLSFSRKTPRRQKAKPSKRKSLTCRETSFPKLDCKRGEKPRKETTLKPLFYSAFGASAMLLFKASHR